MPNHITNELTAPAHVLAALAGPTELVDFEQIIPMPEVLKGEPSMHTIDWARVAMGVVNLKTLQVATPDPLAAFQRGAYGAASQRLEQHNLLRLMTEGPFPKDFRAEEFEQLLRCMRAIKETGYPSWYDWSVQNWGTKWNAYDINQLSPTCVRFDTAWSPPLQVIATLAQRFPTETVRIRWADEDFGSNVGDITLRDNKVLAGGRLTDGSPEAKELALELKHGGELPDYLQRVNGEIVYVEEDE